MLKYTTSPYLWKSCGMLCVEPMIPQQDQMKYTTSYWSIYLMLLFYFFYTFFNKIWLSGDFPSDWRKAIVIPIPKPGKDPTNPTNYRPIDRHKLHL